MTQYYGTCPTGYYINYLSANGVQFNCLPCADCTAFTTPCGPTTNAVCAEIPSMHLAMVLFYVIMSIVFIGGSILHHYKSRNS